MKLLAVMVAAYIALLVLVAVAVSATTSRLLDRNTTNERLYTTRGAAKVTWRGGKATLWNAINARLVQDANGDRIPDRPQVEFKKDYSARTYGGASVCRRYTGPAVPLAVRKCTAPDGTWWTEQKWRRLKANLGGRTAPAELWPSHFTGATAKFVDVAIAGTILTGRYTYRGVGVHGLRTTSAGVPLDAYGRNIYFDVYNSPTYGSGWAREMSFVAQIPDGQFRYAIRSKKAERYRVCALGPGVTPIVCYSWT